ncbi:MAG: glycosyltransferase [bacterium]|nr:glycosyltransferase [bacterium]
MSIPNISIVIPVYKVEKYLRQCLDSVVNQTLKDIEIIIVDEGDMDECRNIIDEYEAKDERIKTIHEKNGGYGASVNKGINLAQGEYVGIVESDDFIDLQMYEKMYNYAKKLNADVVKIPYNEYYDELLGIVGYSRLCPYATNILHSVPQNTLFSNLDYPHLMAVHASVWSGIYKKEYMDNYNIRFISAKGAGYVDVGFRIDTLMNTNKIAWLNEPLYYYRVTNSENSTTNFNLKSMLQRWKEVHEKFETVYKGTYEAVGKYSIYDEYLTTVGYLCTYDWNDEDWKLLKENLSHVSVDVIKKSKKLTKQMKDRLLEIKKKDNRKKCKAYYKICSLKLFRFITLLTQKEHAKHFEYYLFNLISLKFLPNDKPFLW